MSEAPNTRRPQGVVLASASPRRRRLLETLGLPHTIVPSAIDETPEPGEGPVGFAERAALDKARAVAELVRGAPVLAADTVVEIGGTILGKPRDDEDARRMLALLAGAVHRVHTGVALVSAGAEASLVDTTTVAFVAMGSSAIDWYVRSGEPHGKAGAYAIQGIGGLFVSSIEGSPHTVVGLPLHRLPELFAACGLDLWTLLNRPVG